MAEKYRVEDSDGRHLGTAERVPSGADTAIGLVIVFFLVFGVFWLMWKILQVLILGYALLRRRWPKATFTVTLVAVACGAAFFAAYYMDYRNAERAEAAERTAAQVAQRLLGPIADGERLGFRSDASLYVVYSMAIVDRIGADSLQSHGPP